MPRWRIWESDGHYDVQITEDEGAKLLELAQGILSREENVHLPVLLGWSFATDEEVAAEEAAIEHRRKNPTELDKLLGKVYGPAVKKLIADGNTFGSAAFEYHSPDGVVGPRGFKLPHYDSSYYYKKDE